MNDKHYLGRRVASHEWYDEVGPITGVALVIDKENEFLAGDDSGYVLEVESKYGTQAMANNILAAVQNKVYKGYRSTGAMLSPVAELGDGITVDGAYSFLAYRNTTFGSGHMSEIAAPGESVQEHEYQYKSPSQRQTDRKLAVTRSLIEKTSEEIRLSVEELDERFTRVSITLDGLTVTDDSGTTLIKGNSIETETLHVKAANIDGVLTADQIVLTGSITFGDLDANTQSMVQASGISSAEAYTIITSTLVSSPTIMGAKICTTGNNNIYSQMESHGMSVYHNDNDNPKTVLGVGTDGTVHLILGSGDNAGGSTSNRLYLQKEENQAGLYYYPEDSHEPVGFTFADGAIQVHGVLAGMNGAVFA